MEKFHYIEMQNEKDSAICSVCTRAVRIAVMYKGFIYCDPCKSQLQRTDPEIVAYYVSIYGS